MIVVDACVLADALTDASPRGHGARAALAMDDEWAAPEIWRTELLSVIRGLDRGGRITGPEADLAVHRMSQLVVETVGTAPLVPAMWRLRHTMPAYDAAYVALAASRGLTLVTADARLARAAATVCRVEVPAPQAAP